MKHSAPPREKIDEMNRETLTSMIEMAWSESSFDGTSVNDNWLHSTGKICWLDSVVKKLTSLTEFRRSTSNIAMLINFAVSLLNENEYYLNVGVWKGYTLFAGAIRNSSHLCVGVDPFDPAYLARMTPGHKTGLVRAEFERVHRQLNLRNVRLFEMTCERFFLHRFANTLGKNIGCLFYDADHDTEATVMALNLAKPYLSSNCVIIVDDYNIPAVANAVEMWLEENSDFFAIREIRSDKEEDPTWWNGLAFLGRRNGLKLGMTNNGKPEMEG